MKKAFIHMMTGIDNYTIDVVRVIMLLSSGVASALSIYMAIVHGQWSAEAYGISIATILGGGGAGIAMKAKTEPSNTPEQKPNEYG